MKSRATLPIIMALLLSSLAYAAGKPESTRIPADAGLAERLHALGFQVWRPNAPAPGFILPDLTGRDISLQDFQGKIVFLNFWATWCPPCREEMPSMEALYRQLAGPDFAMLAVNLQESASQVGRFVAAGGYSFPVLLDGDGRLGYAYRISGIPTTFIIDKKGNVLARAVGARKWDTPEMKALFTDLIR